MEQNRNVLKWIRYGVLFAYWMVIFAGTHVPGRAISSDLANDKLLHFLAFSGLSFLLAWVLTPCRPTRTAMGAILLVALLYGALDELTQLFVPRRNADIYDWFADVGGTIFGLLAYLVSWTLANEVCGSLLHTTPIAVTPEE
jgi:hypothetical protein